MLKTYLYLPDELDRDIKKLATLQKKSKAETLRTALQEGVKVIKRQRNAGAEVLLKIAELGKKYNVRGPADASERMDEYLWERNWGKDD